MEARKASINDIINGNRVLEIPFFQRSYVWEELQWERFLEDMKDISETNKPYFLGSVILKQQLTSSDRSFGDRRIVIDGQQRLTTLYLFFKVLFLKKNMNGLFDRVFRLHNNEISLIHNRNDIDDFKAILNLNDLNEEVQESDSNIIKAYHYFKKNINDDINYQNLQDRIMFVCIDVQDNENEQQIFDTINSLGVDLTTAELLKNYFFSKDDIELHDEIWYETFEKDEESKKYWGTIIATRRTRRAFIDLFFHSFLQIKVQDKSLDIKDRRNFLKIDDLFDSYKKFIKKYMNDDKKSILNEIKEYAEVFRRTFNKDIVHEQLPRESGIERINALIFGAENSTLIPYILYIAKNIADERVLNDLCGFLESYIVRRMITNENTRSYNAFFSNLIYEGIQSKEEFQKFLSKQDNEVSHIPDNDELKTVFLNSKMTNVQALRVLYLLETKIRNDDKYGTLLKGIDDYSLEHLMPKKWKANWDKLADENQEIARNKIILTIGNLAIITQKLNSSISNACWSNKLDGKNKAGGLRKYASGLETNNFLEIELWNEVEIISRADFLYNQAIKQWKFD